MGRLAVVIPAFNEEQSIAAVVGSASGVGTVIVVDDASTDATAQAAEAAGAEVVRHSVNQGYDAALNSGFARADTLGFDYVITMDADGQHPAHLLEVFAEKLNSSAKVVAGYRDRKARVSEKIFGVVSLLLYGIKDPLCGMKGYHMSVYRELGHFDNYGSIGTGLLLYAARGKKRIEQVLVPVSDRRDVSRFGQGLKSNLRILRALAKGFVHRKASHG